MKIVKCGKTAIIPISEIYQAYECFGNQVRVHYKHNPDFIYSFDLEVGREIIKQWEAHYTNPIKQLKTKVNDYLNTIRANPV